MKKIVFRKEKTPSRQILYTVIDQDSEKVLGTLQKSEGGRWHPNTSLLDNCNLQGHYQAWAYAPLRKPRSFNEMKIVFRHFLNHPHVHQPKLSKAENRIQLISIIRHMIDVDEIRRNIRKDPTFQLNREKPLLKFRKHGYQDNYISVLRNDESIGHIYCMQKHQDDGTIVQDCLLDHMLQKDLGVWTMACHNLRLPLRHAKALCQFLEIFPYDYHHRGHQQYSTQDLTMWLKSASIDYMELREREDLPDPYVYFQENTLCNSVLAYTGEELLISLHKNEINGTWRWGQGSFQDLHQDEYLTPTNLSRARAILERSLFGRPLPKELDSLSVL